MSLCVFIEFHKLVCEIPNGKSEPDLFYQFILDKHLVQMIDLSNHIQVNDDKNLIYLHLFCADWAIV